MTCVAFLKQVYSYKKLKHNFFVFIIVSPLNIFIVTNIDDNILFT